MPKTIAQLAILNWIESHMGICDLTVNFVDQREAFVTDSNGDTMTLKYDSDTREVYAIQKCPGSSSDTTRADSSKTHLPLSRDSISNPLDFGKNQFKEDIFMQKNDNTPKTWEEIEKKHAEMQNRETLASEVIAWSQKVSKAKDFAIGCLTAGIIIVGMGMAIINYCNDRDWRKV